MTNKDKAMANDKRIEEMAVYVITKGTTANMYPKGGVEKMSPTEMQLLQAEYLMKVQDKFAELKRLVKSAEFTMAQLEDKVYEDYGVMEDPPAAEGLPDMKALEKLIRGGDPTGDPFAKQSGRITGFSDDTKI